MDYVFIEELGLDANVTPLRLTDRILRQHLHIHIQILRSIGLHLGPYAEH